MDPNTVLHYIFIQIANSTRVSAQDQAYLMPTSQGDLEGFLLRSPFNWGKKVVEVDGDPMQRHLEAAEHARDNVE